ncbi:MAG: hypothetical protein EOO60_12375 [Hymenobacter sp.]|nr:MAG: hypothetical protein EOO60_12375 [Hymenobacter sp.]
MEETHPVLQPFEDEIDVERMVKTALDQQLVNRYLRNNSAKTGLFLVYWYRPGPDQKGKVNKLAELRQLLAQQAEQASVNGRLVKSYVLDIRLPDDQS